MRPRYLLCITLLAVCHLQLRAQAAQVLTKALPGTSRRPASAAGANASAPPPLPIAVPEPPTPTGVPVQIEALRQTRVGHIWTLTGKVVIHYQDYVIHADKIVYNQATSQVQAQGHLLVTGGPNDVLIKASHGDMNLNAHTARFYDVTGSEGVRSLGRKIVYSTPNPLLFRGRVLIENGQGNYRIVGGSITNCRLPHPDWRIVAHSIRMQNGMASTSNARFDFFGVPVLYLPYLHHPISRNGRESGLLIPVISTGSSITGDTFGDQYYWVINRSMDMVIGSEYYTKRGWAPNGGFRYRGFGLDRFRVQWNSLFDRGINVPVITSSSTAGAARRLPAAPAPVPFRRLATPAAPITTTFKHVNQGGVDIIAYGRKDFTPNTRLVGVAEYLSSYVYRLIFNDNYSQATSSQVSSVVALSHNRHGLIYSGSLQRFQTFASTAHGDEAKILHLPTLSFDVLDRPLGHSPFYWWLDSSVGFLNRAEPHFHARNVARVDFYPHISLPFSAGGWHFVPQAAVRDTYYSISQIPDLTGANAGIPTISHDPINRTDFEAAVDIRPPALERDFQLPVWHRELRHVIEPEITYNYVTGIGPEARNVLLFDTTDIATDTNQVGYSLMQRFYLRPTGAHPCATQTGAAAASGCKNKQREWASWDIEQDFFMNHTFGGALIPGRRNVFTSSLALCPITFLTAPRTISPLISRMRFNAINNLHIEWDLDYDPKLRQLDANNVFASSTHGRTTVGVTYALLNAVDEDTGTSSTTLRSHLLQPFFAFGKPSGAGFNVAVNGGYDFAHHLVQYAGVQAVYNWNCCGLTLGYKRFELGTAGTVSRNETQWIYGFTLANFGAVGNLRRSESIFRDVFLPSLQ
jgi:LPS-assembly protein